MEKLNEKQFRQLISGIIKEALGELLDPVAYPNIAQPDFEDSVPMVKPNKTPFATNDINEKLRRSIFNIMTNFEGQHKEYSIGEIAKSVAERYNVSYDEAYKVARKCLQSRKAKGEADFCVPDEELAAGGSDIEPITKVVAESVKSVLADYKRRESDKQESLKRTVIDELRTYLYEMISGDSIEFPSNDNAATVTTKLYWTPEELRVLTQLYSDVESLAEKYKYDY